MTASGTDPGTKRFLMAAIGAPGEDVKTRKDAGTALLMGETYEPQVGVLQDPAGARNCRDR